MALREILLIDRKVQGVLIGRVLLYWFSAISYLGLSFLFIQYYENPDEPFFTHLKALFLDVWPWLPSSVLLLPLVIFDVVRLSNLFAGPIYRLRHHLAELVVDSSCRPLKFREDDYWQDLAAPINSIHLQLLGLNQKVAAYERRLNQLQSLPQESPTATPLVGPTSQPET